MLIAFEAPPVPPPPPIIDQVLVSPDPAQGDELGRSVAVAGPFIAGGRWLADPGSATNAGAARLWRRTHSGAIESEGEVVAPDGAANDEFGVSVGLSASCDLGHSDDPASWPRLVVGAWSADLPGKVDAGAAYVFRRHPTTNAWEFESKLTALDSAASNQFGRSVAIDGDLVVVGAWQNGFNRGALYIFRRDAGGWVQESKLLASDGVMGDYLGTAVAIQGSRVIGGAYGDDTAAVTNHGAAYVFRRNAPGSWTQEAKLVASDAAGSDEFGRGVAIDGDTAIIGTWPFWSDGPGAAYAFVRDGTTWSQQAKLTHPSPGAADYFGFTVGVSGDVVVVGAWADDVAGVTNQGSSHFFRRVAGTWSHWAELTRPAPQGSAYFGFSVAIDGAVAAIGSRLDDLTHVNQGSVTVVCVDTVVCNNCPTTFAPADFNRDGRVDGNDLGTLLGSWGVCAACAADLNDDGVVDGNDLGALLGQWT